MLCIGTHAFMLLPHLFASTRWSNRKGAKVDEGSSNRAGLCIGCLSYWVAEKKEIHTGDLSFAQACSNRAHFANQIPMKEHL